MTAQTIWGVLPVLERVMLEVRSGINDQLAVTLAESATPDGLTFPNIPNAAIGLGDASTLPLAHEVCIRVVPGPMQLRAESRANVRSNRAIVTFHTHCYVALSARVGTLDPTYQTQQVRMAYALASAVRAVVERMTEDGTNQIAPAMWQGEAFENVATLRERMDPQVWALVRQTYTCTVKLLQSRGSDAP